MAEDLTVGNFSFENKELYEAACKEQKVIAALREKCSLTDGKTALKIYRKAVKEQIFSTIVGYSFLEELRRNIEADSKLPRSGLARITVQGSVGGEPVDEKPVSSRKWTDGKFERLYMGQRLLNKKLKLVIVALLVLLIAFVVIDIKSEYSVFTYFTDYKSNMEEELIDKYKQWENELEAREQALEQSK